jgi:MSHA biogenesis protein MshI
MALPSFLRSFSRGAATAGSVGIACDGSALSAAVVRRNADAKPRVVACGGFEGGDALPAIAKWRSKNGLRRAQANLLLANDEYQILPLDVEQLSAAELAAAARWKVKDMIDFPPEDASVACVRVPGAEGVERSRQALAVVTRRKTVVQWMQRAHAAHFELSAIDVPELALRNIAALLPGTAACGLLHVGISRATLVMVWQGELCTFRRFDLRAGQLLAADGEQREALIERLALDLQRTSDAFERQFHAAALGRMWVTEELPGLELAPALSRYVSPDVLPLKLREYVDVDASDALIDPSRSLDYIPAIGAALRVETPS